MQSTFSSSFHSLTIAVVMVVCSLVVAPTAGTAQDPLTEDQIVQMSSAEVDAEVIVKMIQRTGVAFEISPDKIIELTEAGVPGPVLTALTDEEGELTLPETFGVFAYRKGASEGVPISQADLYEQDTPDWDPTERGFMVGRYNKVVGIQPGAIVDTRLRANDPYFILHLSGNATARDVELFRLKWNGDDLAYLHSDRVAIQTGPVQGEPGMVKVIPTEDLKPGPYAIDHAGSGAYMYPLMLDAGHIDVTDFREDRTAATEALADAPAVVLPVSTQRARAITREQLKKKNQPIAEDFGKDGVLITGFDVKGDGMFSTDSPYGVQMAVQVTDTEGGAELRMTGVSYESGTLASSLSEENLDRLPKITTDHWRDFRDDRTKQIGKEAEKHAGQ